MFLELLLTLAQQGEIQPSSKATANISLVVGTRVEVIKEENKPVQVKANFDFVTEKRGGVLVVMPSLN